MMHLMMLTTFLTHEINSLFIVPMISPLREPVFAYVQKTMNVLSLTVKAADSSSAKNVKTAGTIIIAEDQGVSA